MNIFYLHHDTKTCAELHNDKHVVKMILEYAQLLSTAHRVIDGVLVDGHSPSGRKKKIYLLADNRDSNLYATTHINHPSAVWVRKRESHYRWLFQMWVDLMDEYTYRYGRIHASARLIPYLNVSPKNIELSGEFEQPTPAMPDVYKVSGNSVRSYINYYLGAKQHLAAWKKRQIPEWFTYA
jgi:hypothetical protein